MFGGLSERKAPQSLYAGVVFAGNTQGVENLYCTAGGWWTLKAFAENAPSKTSYCHHTLAAALWQLKKLAASMLGGKFGPPSIGALHFDGRIISAPTWVCRNLVGADITRPRR